MLLQTVELVNKSNAAYLSIACNTAHILLPALQKVSKKSFISMIDEVAEHVNKDTRTKIGLLGTPSTIKYGLYQKALAKYDISVVVPTQKQILTLEKVIRNVLAGEKYVSDQKKLRNIANSLVKHGAEGIILGCTELPLIFPVGYSLPVYNSLEILAEALLRKYYRHNTMRQRI